MSEKSNAMVEAISALLPLMGDAPMADVIECRADIVRIKIKFQADVAKCDEWLAEIDAVLARRGAVN